MKRTTGIAALVAVLAAFGVPRYRPRHHRQLDDERGARVGSLTVSRHLSAVQLHQVLDDRKPEPQSALLPRARAIGLHEALAPSKDVPKPDTIVAFPRTA